MSKVVEAAVAALDSKAKGFDGTAKFVIEGEGAVYIDANGARAAYDEAVVPLFQSLDWLEDLLSANRYLTGDRLTEADWRLFTTAVRFDPVYHTHFKCNHAWLREYPNLWVWTRELYQMPGVAETVDFAHIVRHYHYSHDTINPHRIIPINPTIDWDEPHDRGGF